jgi:hypothetical protein
MDPFRIRNKTYKNGTQVMSHPHKKGPDQRPSQGNGILIPVMDRIILLWAACMAKKMITIGADGGDETSKNILKSLNNNNKEKEVIYLIDLAIAMGNSEKTFIFKTKWFNESIYKIGNGQAWRCRWERLCGKRYCNKKSNNYKNNTHVNLKDKLKTEDLSKIIPIFQEKEHPLEKFNNFTFEEMWNFIY